MKQTTKRFLSMILGLVLTVAAFMTYFQFIKPAYSESQEVKSRQLGRDEFLRKEQEAVEKVKKLISIYQAQSEVQEKLSLALPTEEESAGALAQVYGIAKNTGLEFRSASVSVLGEQAGSPESAQKEAAARRFSLQKPVGALSLNLQLFGTYEEFKEFLKLLENNLRIFDVTNVSVTQGETTGSKSLGLHGFNLSVVTYYQINQ